MLSFHVCEETAWLFGELWGILRVQGLSYFFWITDELVIRFQNGDITLSGFLLFDVRIEFLWVFVDTSAQDIVNIGSVRVFQRFFNYFADFQVVFPRMAVSIVFACIPCSYLSTTTPLDFRSQPG